MKERMLRGDLYIADDEDLGADFRRAQEILEYGTRVGIGAGTFFNYDCLMLDVDRIEIP
jgi:hypothetical protein